MPARFGFPPYGGSITQNVYYVDDKSSFCSHSGLRPDHIHPTPKDGQYPEPPFIMMTDQWACTYVSMVKREGRN